MSAVIETVGLEKNYPQGDGVLRVLKGIDIKVIEGEFMAIMGPSGSGKSTLLNMLGALDKPSAGKIVIHGTDLSTLLEKGLSNYCDGSEPENILSPAKELSFIPLEVNLPR